MRTPTCTRQTRHSTQPGQREACSLGSEYADLQPSSCKHSIRSRKEAISHNGGQWYCLPKSCGRWTCTRRLSRRKWGIEWLIHRASQRHRICPAAFRDNRSRGPTPIRSYGQEWCCALLIKRLRRLLSTQKCPAAAAAAPPVWYYLMAPALAERGSIEWQSKGGGGGVVQDTCGTSGRLAGWRCSDVS
jgi:hypothetical protein